MTDTTIIATRPEATDIQRDGARDVQIEIKDRGDYLHIDLLDLSDTHTGSDEVNLDDDTAGQLHAALGRWLKR